MSETDRANPLAPKPASEATCQHNRSMAAALPFGDTQDFTDARRGFIASMPKVEIRNAEGRVVWSLEEYAFLAAEAPPDTVNPSLWRQARLNMHHGLFQVKDRIYQVRGYDISNMTILEGSRGVVVIDPLVSAETARAALELYFASRGRRPVTAVIYSHSHVDHFGGVRGVVDEKDVDAGLVQIIAPDRFLEEVTAENVIAGSPMIRRAQFQFGPTLFKGPRGQVDAGLGKVISRGSVGLIPPTLVIRQPIETHVIDGIEILFQLTPDTEAKAEMHMLYPGLGALNLAENATHNLHNVYPIRGAQVRDALAWAKYLGEARERFAPKVDVVFAQHHWPVWGSARVMDYLAKQRDAYKYLHDQTVRLMNHGWKAAEIAERLDLPESLAGEWSVRGYYGTFSHNAKSIYQRYIGWYDANAANLAPHPPVERARRTVTYMGGAAAVLTRAREDFAAGDYRWVADVASQVVFAEPENGEARALAADAYEQLGYQAESATWRNAYLLGAYELRHGTPKSGARAPVAADVVRALTAPLLFDYLGVRLDGFRAAGKRFAIDVVLTDLAERYRLNLENCALTWSLRDADAADAPGATAAATVVTGTKAALVDVCMRRVTLQAAIAAGQLRLDGERAALEDLLALLDDFPLNFPVVEPRSG
jgi:alkyl sulfatase BDS1-like metallo-beta-lactamase superfamily hydrolase